MLIRGSIGFLLLLADFTLAPAYARQQPPSPAKLPSQVAQQVTEDADWILQGQLPDGAICWYIDRKHISPYLGDYAAWGLVRAHRVTGKLEYLRAAYRWLLWYQSHEDQKGYVTDYNVDAGKEISTGDEDSTDAYAGVFLLAAREWYRDSNDLAGLRALRKGIQGAVAAMVSTQQPDGLTYAKPSYPVEYLMDSAESYSGLRAGAELLRRLEDIQGADRAATAAMALQQGVSTLWNQARGNYDYARTRGGTTTSDWSRLYPDATSQVWVAALGNWPAPEAPLDSRHTAALAQAFVTAWPHWDQPLAKVSSKQDASSVDCWPLVALALANAGRRQEALQGAAHIREAANTARRAWPFTTGIAGELILAESL